MNENPCSNQEIRACCLNMGLNLKMLKMSLTGYLHRGSYMSAHVLLNYLTSSGKEIKCEVPRISNKQIKLNYIYW